MPPTNSSLNNVTSTLFFHILPRVFKEILLVGFCLMCTHTQSSPAQAEVCTRPHTLVDKHSLEKTLLIGVNDLNFLGFGEILLCSPGCPKYL